jgi:hypothetical protein
MIHPEAKRRAIESGGTHLLLDPYGDYTLFAPSPHTRGKWLRVAFAYFEDEQKWLMFGFCTEIERLPSGAVVLE